METQPTFSHEFSKYLARVRSAQALRFVPDPDTPLIEVDAAFRSIAGFYERTRNTLEYGEADFLRERAMARALRRMLNFAAMRSPSEEALELLREFIRAGYFPNARIPEAIAEPVGNILERLVAAVDAVNPLFHDELIQFAAFEIEDTIFPERAAAQAATIAFALETCDAVFRWPQTVRQDRAHRAFLFVATHRAVLQAKSARILFAFVREAFPQWRRTDPNDIASQAEEFERVLAAAKRAVADPRSEQYTRAIRKFATSFQALDVAVSAMVAEGRDDTMSIFDLERRVEEAVAHRVKTVKQKLRQAAVRATFYVFFTKIIVGLAIELPYDYYVLGQLFTQPFFINLIFPPLLMFLVAFSARPPRAAAAERVLEDAMRIATASGTIESPRFPRPRGKMRLIAFTVAVLGIAAFAINVIIRGLKIFQFSLMSTAIFLVFLSVVSLFAWRVRKPLRDFAVQTSQGVLWTFIEILLFPFLFVGRLLSDGIRRVNIFFFVLDVFIEAPLKFLFSVGEDWLAFLREKREELVEE